MINPTVQVEIEFVTGTWTDVTAYLVTKEGVTITRGREDESSVTSPGACTFTLKNEDGRFTPKYTAGAYYPNVVRLKRVRVSIRSRRFTGYVDVWSVPAGQRRGYCRVRCIDRQTLDGKRYLASLATESLNLRAPLKHWDLTTGAIPADLQAKYSGAAGGTLDWGSGDTLRADDNAGVKFTPATNETTGAYTGGWRLEGDYTLPASYSVVISYGSSSTAGPLLRLGTVAIDLEGQAPTWKGATTSLKLRGEVEIISVDASGVILSSDPTRVVRTPPATATQVSIGGTQGAWSGASVSHVAVLPYLTSAQMDQLYLELTRAAMPVSSAIALLLSMSGAGVATPTVLGSDPAVILPSMSGQPAQAMIDSLATGAVGRYAIDSNGAPRWVSYDYLPAAVSPPASVGILPETTWEPDLGAWVTDATTTLLDGSTYSYSDAVGLDHPAIDVPGVMATDSARRAVAAWLVDYSSDDPRLSGLGVDLLPLNATTVDVILGLDLGSRLTVSGLPSYIPATPTVVVEGYSETYTQDSWTIQLNTSPSLVGSWFAWGDAWGSKPWKPF